MCTKLCTKFSSGDFALGDLETLIQLDRQCGLNLQEAENAVESGIYAVWQLMTAGKLKGFRSLGNFLSEFRLYRRNEDGRVVKQKDHLMDAMRYLVMSDRDRMKVKQPAAPKAHELVYNFGDMAQKWMF